MDNNDDIELHGIETIEARLRTELPTEVETREGEAGPASTSVLGAASSFLVT